MSFNIEFDYRFDTDGFFTAPVRQALEASARIWEGIIGDEFPDFSAGQTITTANPQTGQRATVTIDREIDDLLIFVGARNLGGALGIAGPDGYDASGDENRLRIANDFRGQGAATDFEPYIGTVAFNVNSNWNFEIDGPVAGKSDFISTALHEIGHVLGFSTTGSYDAFVSGATFTGPNARAANGGQPIPLVSNTNGHVQDGFLNNTVLLDPTSTTGRRKMPTDIDKAMLADIGYEIEGFTKQGTPFAIATEGAEVIFGRDIADTIDGLGGDDQIQGDEGDDRLRGGGGEDSIFGGGGTDRFYFGTGDGRSRINDFDFRNEKIVIDPAFGFTTAEEVLALVSSPFSNIREIKLGGDASAYIFTNGTGNTLQASNIEFGTLGSAPVSGPLATNGDDVLIGTAAADTIDGLGGNDRVEGAGGNDILRGGTGQDSLFGQSGNDLLIGGSLSASTTSAGAQVYRVYQATLDRAPDSGGMEGWVDAIESGNSTLQNVVSGFVRSAEFQQTYGSLDDTGFVTLLYNNVLDREPDQPGLNGWLQQLSNGGTREGVVTGFSESAEFRATTAPAARAYTDAMDGRTKSEVTDDVFRLYRATLDRDPDAAGLDAWTTNLADGLAYTDAARGFTGSAEFRNTYGNLDDTAFIEQLYRNVLDREADAAGLSNWQAVIDGGGTREDVVRGFAQGREFINATRADFKAYAAATRGDVLDGGIGDDTLLGGAAADTFVFNAAQDGRDVVLRLDTWDTLRFDGFGYGSAAEAQARMSEVGADMRFADQGVTITFTGADAATLQEVDYLFA